MDTPLALALTTLRVACLTLDAAARSTASEMTRSPVASPQFSFRNLVDSFLVVTRMAFAECGT